MVLDYTLEVSEFWRSESMVASQPERTKPELRDIVIPLNMNMRGLARIC